MKREVRTLRDKAIDSLLLAIDHFNRPWDQGRHEATLILLDRSFELLLKAAIVHRSGRIRAAYAKETIGFDKCVRKCLSDADVKCLTEDQAITVQIINSLRDAAQHYIVEVSEQQLYMYAQAGVTLFGEVLDEVFGEQLRDYLPERVLPVSTSPPRDLHSMIDAEFKDIKSLVAPGSRKRLQARARLRALAIIEASLQGVRSQPGEPELKRFVREIQAGKGWRRLFPGVSRLQLQTEGTGLDVSIRLTKREGDAVRLVPEGTPGATVVAVKRVNELSFYSLGLNDLASKVGLTAPKTGAMINYLDLRSSPDYYREIKVGHSRFKRYSNKAVQAINEALPDADIDEIWKKHGYRTRPKPRG